MQFKSLLSTDLNTRKAYPPVIDYPEAKTHFQMSAHSQQLEWPLLYPDPELNEWQRKGEGVLAPLLISWTFTWPTRGFLHHPLRHCSTHRAPPLRLPTPLLSVHNSSPAQQRQTGSRQILSFPSAFFLMDSWYFKESPLGGRMVTCWDWWASPDREIFFYYHCCFNTFQRSVFPK